MMVCDVFGLIVQVTSVLESRKKYLDPNFVSGWSRATRETGEIRAREEVKSFWVVILAQRDSKGET